MLRCLISLISIKNTVFLGDQVLITPDPSKKYSFWDVGMELRDVGCVRISFAINSKAVSAHSERKSIKSYWNLCKI